MDYIVGEFTYHKKAKETNKGLCKDGCGEGTCHFSWPKLDLLKGKSSKAMYRCKPAFL